MITECRMMPGLIECYRQGDEGPRGIRGTAAVYYDGTRATEYPITENLVERISPGAFDDADMSDVVGLWNHDDSLMLGRNISDTMTVSLSSRGLEYDIPQVPSSRADLLEAVERRDVQGSSFRFQMQRDGASLEIGENGVEVINVQRIFRVIDVGPATRPAYSGTTAQARTADLLEELRGRMIETASKGELAAWRDRKRKILTKMLGTP